MEKGNAKKEALIYKIRIRVGAKLIAEHQKDKLVHDLKLWQKCHGGRSQGNKVKKLLLALED